MDQLFNLMLHMVAIQRNTYLTAHSIISSKLKRKVMVKSVIALMHQHGHMHTHCYG